LANPVPARLSTGDLRKFGLLVGAAFFVLGCVLRWRDSGNAALVLWGISAALVGLGLLLPSLLRPVYRGWMGLALLLSKVTTPIVMGVLYFVIMTPVGWLLRAFGHHPLVHGGKGQEIWIARAPDARRSDMERQF
jgi:hypothetical protein